MKDLEYFKKELVKILDKKERAEKAEIKKSFAFAMDMLFEKSSGGYPVGTIREWKGKKYQKIAPGKWRRKYSSKEKGIRMSFAALKKAVDKCSTSQELLNLVLQNRDRFSDDNGRPLPIVKELSDYVSGRNDTIESGNKKEKPDLGKKEPKAKNNNYLREKTKKGALKVLTREETHDFIEKHKTSKENVRVSLGDISEAGKKRIKEKTGFEVERVILDSDSVRHAYNNENHNLEPNDLDDMKEVIDTTTDISLSPDKNGMGNPVIVFKKQEPNGVILCEEYRAGKKELELQTAYRIKKNQQPHGAENQPPANVRNATAPSSNIPQNNSSVNKIAKETKTSLDKAKDLLSSSDSSSVSTLKQFKKWTDRIKFFLPSMKVLNGDEDAKFVISLSGAGYDNDVGKFDDEFKAIFDDKFDYDGFESGGGVTKYFYNPKEKDVKKSYSAFFYNGRLYVNKSVLKGLRGVL